MPHLPFKPAIQLLAGFGLTLATAIAVRGEPGTGPDEFADLQARYGKIHTLAGRGQVDSNGGNDWLESYEGGPARDAELSEAHNAQADVFGNVYLVDKDSHAIRKVTVDGRIHRVAGINVPGDGGDDPQPGTDCALSGPNGLHVQPDGTCYIFDVGNQKIRRLGTDGLIATVFRDPGVSFVGRGLWVTADGTLIYYASGTEVRRWTEAGGIEIVADGFSALGNLTVDPTGRLVVTDRSGHWVYRIDADGTKTPIAGNGTAVGGGSGQPALSTGLEEPRGVAFLPSGGFLVATHRGSDVWFIDSLGIAHLFIEGVRNSDPFAGEGTLAASSGLKLSEIRAINITPGGDLIITHSDQSTVRIVENLLPPAISSPAIRILPPDQILEVRWASMFDGGYLETTGDVPATAWTTLAAAGASREEHRWITRTWQQSPRAFFRVQPARRWPAP